DEYLDDDEVTTYDNIAIKVATDSKINPTTKQVAWIETINDLLGTTEAVEVYYGDDIYLGKVNVTIKNKYTEDYLDFTGLSTILAKVKTESFVTYNDETYKVLKSIETNEENLKFTIENGEFTVTDINGKNINSTYTPTYFKFTFFDGEHEDKVLTYTYLCSSKGEVTIKPYTPEFKEAKNPVTAQEYDLINAVINLATMDKTNVESVVVTAASNETMFVDDFATKIKGHGYTSSTPSGICNATFKRFEGDTKIITITYTITYKDGVTYELTKDLVVENDQALTMVYPFADITENLSNSNLNFTSESEKIKFANTVDLEHAHYEPVLAGSTITSDADDNMFLTRALVADRNGSVITGAISKIEIVGYLNNSVGQTYHSHVKVVGNSVLFESEGITGGTFTYIIIKITTTSQNYNYYVAHVYSTDKQTDYAGVSSNNLYTLNKAYDGIMKDGTIFVDTTLDDIGSQIKPLNSSFVENVRFYLLNATELNGDVCTTLKDKFNTEISSLTLSEYLENNKFYTLIIGVVFVKDSVIFNAGRIVANILPTGFYDGTENSYLSDLEQTGTDKVTEVQDQPGRYTKTLAN
nr:hypothetical protein [Clostridia bacterium]